MFGFFKKQKNKDLHSKIFAPIDGDLMPLEKVNDPVFSEKMLGDGVAIKPRGSTVVSPCDGEITMIYPTLHAFGVTTNDGVEILIHIGIDTVKLNAKGFSKYVDVGERVKIGAKIISFDDNYLLEDKIDFTTMMVFPNNEKEIIKKNDGYVRRGKDVVIKYIERRDNDEK